MSPPPAKRKPPEKATDNRKAIRNLISLLKDYKLKLTLTVLFGIISTLFSVISPMLIGQATTTIYNGINNIINHTGTIDLNSVFYTLSIVIVLYIISSVFSYLQSYVIIGISTSISYNLRSQIMDKITSLAMDNVDENKRGDILSRLTNDVDSLQTGITQAFLQMLTAIITIIGVVGMMLYINVWMTLATVVLIPISFAMIIVVTRFSQSYFLKQLVYKGAVNSQIEETFTGHDIIRAFNQEEPSIEKFENDNDMWYDQEWKSQFFSSLTGPAMNFISNFAYVIIAVLGAIFALQKTISVGDICEV